MNNQKIISRHEFEEYKIGLLKAKNKYFIGAMEFKKKLIADEAKMTEKNLRLYKPTKRSALL